MNCKQENEIPLAQILKAMGCKPLTHHSGGGEEWYENPLREERTASFSVNAKKNLWHDFGTGEGGKVIDLVISYTNSNVKGALEWLDDNLGTVAAKNTQPYPEARNIETKARFEVLKVQRLLNPALLDYVASRGIDPVIARNYLKEIRYLDTVKSKEFFGLGSQNLAGGYSIRNKYMKTNIAPMGIVHFQADGYTTDIHVFEGIFDFLTYKTIQDQSDNKEECIILNSTTMAMQAAELIRNDINHANKQVILWLDNEDAGSKASESVGRATGYFTGLECQVLSANENYKGYNDLNAYWMATKQRYAPKFKNLRPDSTAPKLSN